MLSGKLPIPYLEIRRPETMITSDSVVVSSGFEAPSDLEEVLRLPVVFERLSPVASVPHIRLWEDSLPAEADNHSPEGANSAVEQHSLK